jgi:predicted nucleic-acid-binding Zn-ribbon protein
MAMSKMTPHNLECPHCGNKQEAMMWDSVNVTLDSESKRTLFDAQINLFSCEKCGKKTFINTPLLYHDMTQQFCVQYYPPEAVDDPKFFRQFNPDGSLAMTGIPAGYAESGAYLTRPQIVFDMTEMLRYVAFRDRINEVRKESANKEVHHIPDPRRVWKR